jgi:hypothetical protein
VLSAKNIYNEREMINFFEHICEKESWIINKLRLKTSEYYKELKKEAEFIKNI